MKLVLCEGKDELAVLNGLCGAAGIAGLVVEEIGGRDNLEGTLRELPKRPEFTRLEVESLALVIDADASAENAWQKLRNAVRVSFGLELSEIGIFVGDRPKIAGFVISDQSGKGMLESLCLEAVSDKPGYACLESYFECLQQKIGNVDFHPKQRFNAWMASQTKEGLRVGLAAGKGYVPWESPAFAGLRSFLQNL